MELKLYLRMLQRGWWIVALTALFTFNVALLLAYEATPLYRSSTRFLIGPNIGILTNQADVIRLLDSQAFVPTYAEIWNSDLVFNQTGEALKLSPEELDQYDRSAVILPSANILELTVSGPNPTLVALLANTMGEVAIAKAADQMKLYTVTALDRAVIPPKPFSPQPARDASLAAVLGLMLGAGLAILSEQLRIPLDALRQRMMRDSESSAFNRAYFQRTIEDELKRNYTGVVTLGLVQLVGLEDLYGNIPPVLRQRLLHQTTQTLRKELRGGDQVGRWNTTCFGVLLPATPAVAANRTLARIQQALSVPVEIDRNGEQITLFPHVGVVVVNGSETLSAVIRQAENALELARQNDQHLVLQNNVMPPSPS